MSDVTQDQARLVIPAPTTLRGADGPAWYEVRLLDDPGPHPPELGRRGPRVVRSIFRTTLAADHSITTSLAADGASLEITLRVDDGTSGRLAVTATVGGHEIVVSGRRDDPSTADRVGDLALPEREARLLGEWGHLGAPLESLAQATRNSWSCTPCIVLSAALTAGVGCCAAGAAPCCVGLLSSGAQFLENCEGSCAGHLTPHVIVEQTSWA